MAASLLAVATAVLVLTLGDSTPEAAADRDDVGSGFVRLAAMSEPASTQRVPLLDVTQLDEAGYDRPAGRVLTTIGGGRQVIAIPQTTDDGFGAERLICVIVTDATAPTRGAGACNGPGDFDRDGLFATLTRGNPDTDEVVGVVPDGVRSVVVHGGSQSPRTFDVEDNVVSFPHSGATSVTFTNADRVVERPIGSGLDE